MESYQSVRNLLLLTLLFAACSAYPADLAQELAQNSDIAVTVSLGPGEQSGTAHGTVRIHASREAVWSLITSCPESIRLVPGLEACEVLETAPDQSWQRIRQVMNYSWLVPKVTYVIRASYDPPTRVAVERMSGDLRTLRGTWELTSDGTDTVARYMVDLAPGFWVPHWIVLSALRKDLPKMLRALRTRAEAGPHAAR
jgi:hypothetical protein